MVFCAIFVAAEFEPLKVEVLRNEIVGLANNLPQKYCPMRNFKGELFCPPLQRGFSSEETGVQNDEKIYIDGSPNVQANNEIDVSGFAVSEGESEDIQMQAELVDSSTVAQAMNQQPQSNGIISGFGFDRVKREVKFPVLPSGDHPVAQKKVDVSNHRFGDIEQFLRMIYKEPAQNKYEAGLYVQNDATVRQLANAFSLAYTNVGVSQKVHTSFITKVKSMSALPEFTAIVNSLPAWNPNDPSVKGLYDMLIQFYGTDVSVDTEHGGTIYQQTTIKECYSANVNADMQNDLEHKIRNQNLPNSAYARYRKLGHFNVLGGNPELGSDKIAQRIASFDQAPAPVKFTTVPLYQLIHDATRKNWVKAAIDLYVAQNKPNVDTIMNQIRHAKFQSFRGPQRIILMDYQIEQHAIWVVHWKDCPLARPRGSVYTPHCARTRSPVMMSAGQNHNHGPPFYTHQAQINRDGPSGNTRIISLEKGHVKYGSNWLNRGCQRTNYGPILCQRIGRRNYCLHTYRGLFRYVCMDCVPVIKDIGAAKYGFRHTVPECHCSDRKSVV